MSPKRNTKKDKSKKKRKAAVSKRTPKKKQGVKKPAKKRDIIVVSPVDPSARFVVASEMADDKLIEAELMGEVLPFYIYQFEQQGKKTVGLSVKGVNEVVRRLNRDKKSGYNIRINPDHLKIEHNIDQAGDMGVQVSVYAENMLDGNSAWGIKFEAYQKTGRNGKYKNDFAAEKALSKAERNAKRKLIPEPVVVKMIEKMLAADPNAVQQIEAPRVQVTTVKPLPPKPSSPEEVKQLIRQGIAECKTVEKVMEFDRKTQESGFDDAFKKEVRGLASTRVDQLNSK